MGTAHSPSSAQPPGLLHFGFSAQPRPGVPGARTAAGCPAPQPHGQHGLASPGSRWAPSQLAARPCPRCAGSCLAPRRCSSWRPRAPRTCLPSRPRGRRPQPQGAPSVRTGARCWARPTLPPRGEVARPPPRPSSSHRGIGSSSSRYGGDPPSLLPSTRGAATSDDGGGAALAAMCPAPSRMLRSDKCHRAPGGRQPARPSTRGPRSCCGEVTEPTRRDKGLAPPRRGQRLGSARRGGLLGCHNRSALGAASAGAVSGVKFGVTWIEHRGGCWKTAPPPQKKQKHTPPVPGHPLSPVTTRVGRVGWGGRAVLLVGSAGVRQRGRK